MSHESKEYLGLQRRQQFSGKDMGIKRHLKERKVHVLMQCDESNIKAWLAQKRGAGEKMV